MFGGISHNVHYVFGTGWCCCQTLIFQLYRMEPTAKVGNYIPNSIVYSNNYYKVMYRVTFCQGIIFIICVLVFTCHPQLLSQL